MQLIGGCLWARSSVKERQNKLMNTTQVKIIVSYTTASSADSIGMPETVWDWVAGRVTVHPLSLTAFPFLTQVLQLWAGPLAMQCLTETSQELSSNDH